MHIEKKNVLLVAMPFAGTNIPSIQLAILENYLKERDANILTKNLFLKAAEFYGINNYNFLIHPPNESYIAQIVFSRYVFPKHWSNNEKKIRIYFNEKIFKNNETYKDLTFDCYVQKTDNFYNWILKNVEWNNYDLIGFTLNYGQFLPSLAIAKKIKEIYPEKIIIFGGSRTVGKLGIKILKAFDFVDFIVSGDGEESLFRLVTDYKNYEAIPGLIFKKGKNIIWNNSDNNINLNDLSIPSYDNFYQELNNSSTDVQQFFQYFGYLPIEISRGCEFKCDFCPDANPIQNFTLERVLEEAVVNLEQNDMLLLHALDVLSYKSKGNNLVNLIQEVKEQGANRVYLNHAAIHTIIKKHESGELQEITKALGLGSENLPWLPVQVGVETGNERLAQEHIRRKAKGENWSEKVVEGYEVMIKHNWFPYGNVILGLPGETVEEANDTFILVKKLKEYGPSFLTVTAYVPSNKEVEPISENVSEVHEKIKKTCLSHTADSAMRLYVKDPTAKKQFPWMNKAVTSVMSKIGKKVYL